MAEPSTPRRSKLNWYNSVRGADLTSAEFRILVLLATYSNASRENAYPGVENLAADSGIDKRRVQRILRSLEAKRAIVATQEGGNQVFKGAATVYKILTPPQRDKGETPFTLHDDESADKGGTSTALKGGTHTTLQGNGSGIAAGDKSGSKGGKNSPTRVAPVPPHQVIHQVINIIQLPRSLRHSLRKRRRASRQFSTQTRTTSSPSKTP